MTSKRILDGKDFLWFINNQNKLSDEFSDCYILIQNKSVKFTYSSYSSAINDIVNLNQIKNYMIQPCADSMSSYVSYINRVNQQNNIYKAFILIHISNTKYLTPYILLEVGDLMTIGSKVYHVELKMNLVVCQISSGRKVICINPQNSTENSYQTLVVDANKLVNGWKNTY